MLTASLLLICALGTLLFGRIIDVNTEQVLTLSSLAKRLPHRRNDRPVCPATIHRWRQPGVRGIRLECVRIGGIWHTSLEAYQRWVERLTKSADPVLECVSPPSVVTTSIVDRTQEAIIDRRLEDLDPLKEIAE